MTGGLVTGTAYFHPTDPNIVPAAIRLSFPPSFGLHQLNNIPVKAFAPDFGQAIDRQQMAVLYPASDVSETANVTLSFNEGNAVVSFNSALTSGEGSLTRARSTPSGLAAVAMSS